jgi:tRNA-modifying protein YgfZ
MTPSSKGQRGAFFDLSRRTKLRITGGDAFRFLNGQITNDLRKASACTAIQASILNAKGKLSGHVFVSSDEAGFFLDADPELREELRARLDRYIIADDVQLEDVTDRFSIFHVTSETVPSGGAPWRSVFSNRLGCQGWDLWCGSPEATEIHRQLAETLAFCDEAGAEVLRIEKGIPRWTRELTNEIIPVEANLEETAIDYGKGCYIGQEVISRMKMSGQTNKRLCGLVSLSGEPLTPGTHLATEGGESKDAGWITSATQSARLGKEIALGYVKRGFNSVGTRLRAVPDKDLLEAGGVPVEVALLPFV